MTGKEVTVNVDRLLNSAHPKYKDMVYGIFIYEVLGDNVMVIENK